MGNRLFTRLMPLVSAFLLCQILPGQTLLDGYIFEENNRGYLNQVKITIYELPDNAVRTEVFSDAEGHFSAQLAPGKYRLAFRKDVFRDKDETVEVGSEKVFLKIEMARKPGYLFDATIAESRDNPDHEVDAIQQADIEIYNRTQKRPELVLKRYKDAFFQFTFEQGNHYTIMVRKPGYLAKRIEAYVNIEGCIICVDGVSNLRPGMTENLTAGNTMGTLLCNIELDRAKIDKRIAIRNIYYDYDKWDIRPDAAKELDKVVNLLMDNPGITVELGSHTDARGGDPYNLTLSQKRAESAVAYIVSEGILAERITAQGYGETQLTNRCKNGVQCSEEEHQQNRRTELRITGVSLDSLDYLRWQALEEIVREEEFRRELKALENQPIYKVEEKTAPAKQEEKPKPQATTPQKSGGNKAAAKPLPEANNSVPLPAFQKPEGQSAQAPASEKMEVVAEEDASMLFTKIQLLPTNFSGFNVEIARTDIALPSNHAAFSQHSEIFEARDAEGMHCYYIGNFSNLARAQHFYQNVAVPKFPSARLCEFKKGVRNYVQ